MRPFVPEAKINLSVDGRAFARYLGRVTKHPGARQPRLARAVDRPAALR
jgi:hypothetical protein